MLRDNGGGDDKGKGGNNELAARLRHRQHGQLPPAALRRKPATVSAQTSSKRLTTGVALDVPDQVLLVGRSGVPAARAALFQIVT